MTEGVNSFDSYVLLFSLDFKFVVVLKNTDEALSEIWSCTLYVTHATNFLRVVATDLLSFLKDISQTARCLM